MKKTKKATNKKIKQGGLHFLRNSILQWLINKPEASWTQCWFDLHLKQDLKTKTIFLQCTKDAGVKLVL